MKTAVWCTMVVQLLVLFGVSGTAVPVRADGQSGRNETAAGRAPFVVEVKPLVAAPSEVGKWEAWREGLRAERQRVRERLG